MIRDDVFWELGMLPKKKKTDLRPRAYDVEAVEVEAEAPESASTVGGRIPSRAETPQKDSEKELRPRISELFDEITVSEMPSKKERNLALPVSAAQRHIPSKQSPPDGSKPRESYPDAPIRKYAPSSGMIREVEVFAWPSSYGFYAQFRRDAMRYLTVRGKPAPRVGYFSYIPQYSQLNRAQLEYYLWWRENVRAHHYPEADFSYILLYIYEILNLPDRVPVKEGMSLLCDIWLAYRDRNPKLDKYMAEWICDYGLIYGLPCPFEKLASVKDVCLELCSLREYYVMESDLAAALSEYASYHSFRKTKYAKGEFAPLFKKYVPMALAYTIDAAARDGLNLFSFEDMRIYRVERDAFCGSLCAHNIKRRIVVSYLSLGRSHELRELVTNIVKYTENGIRAHVKIRSMLSVGVLPPEIRGYVDAFLRETFGIASPGSRRSHGKEGERKREDYEILYDVPNTPVSPEKARAIENASWSATEVLTSTFSDEESEAPTVGEASFEAAERNDVACRAENTPDGRNNVTPSPHEENSYSDLVRSLNESERTVLFACLDGKDVSAVCRNLGILTDAAVAAINETASDLTGDILIEAADGGYHIVDDYAEELAECRI